jgi:hypothetical protein
MVSLVSLCIFLIVFLILLIILFVRSRKNKNKSEYRVHEVPDAFTAAECQRVIEYSKGRMKPSTVAGVTAVDKVADRTSETSWITYGSRDSRDSRGSQDSRDDEMQWFSHKFRDLGKRLTGIIDDALYEDISIVRYEPGQHYGKHFDACTTERNCKGNVRLYRRATLILYLNDGFEDGGTHFPRIGKVVVPVAGNVVWFENVDASGVEIPESIHSGLPVRAGVKWIATLWIKFTPSLVDIKFLSEYK